jgi:hypothetical protein
MPRTRKPAGTAVDARNGRPHELPVAAGPGRAPVIDRGLYNDQTLMMWDAYWADPVAVTQSPADVMWALVWIDAIENYWELKARATDEPLVEGSMGQMIASPLFAAAKDALAAMEKAAKQLGIGARNRADLGVTMLQEKQALDDINARYLATTYTTSTGPAADDADDDPRDPIPA